MRLSTVAAALAFSSIPTLAIAHGNVPFDTPNVIHACRSALGILRQITAGTCVGGEVIVHWNIAGPAGTNGTNGTNGTPGIDGTNGIDGINGTNGTNGTDGTNGTNGTNGANGTNGIDGTNGTNGTRPDGPCFINTNRYVNCLNGTVTDTVTGLIWLQDAACLGTADWAAANGAAAVLANGQCSLTDKSSPGDWRLPTKDEWSATIARAVALGCTGFAIPAADPSLTNDAGTACYGLGLASSFAGVASDNYWSGTTYEVIPGGAWYAFLGLGGVNTSAKANALRVWPVRGGPR
jgi:hypothetical protein